MLQKLEDFYTYKDWKVWQKKESRPIFGPLIKVTDSPDDKPSSVELHTRYNNESGNTDNRKDKTCDYGNRNNSKLPSTSKSTQNKSIESNEKTSEEEGCAPGWYSVLNWTEKFQHDMQIPEYTGCRISMKDYDDHLSQYCERTKQNSQNKPTSQHRKKESLYRPPEAKQTHHQNSNIKAEIDQDIAEIASELMSGDSVIDVVNKMAVKLDCQQWKSRITSSQTTYQKQPPRTKTISFNESTITVNITETSYPLLNRKPTTNTKTPSHTPALPVQRQNMFAQIPFSTKALLQRSYKKLNFLSSKQTADPEKTLFQQKSNCDVNFTHFWNITSQSFVICPSYEYHPAASVIDISKSFIPSSVASKNPERKRTTSSHITEQPMKRQKTVVTVKKSHVKTGYPVNQNNIDLFGVPIYIPSVPNKDSKAYRQC